MRPPVHQMADKENIKGKRNIPHSSLDGQLFLRAQQELLKEAVDVCQAKMITREGNSETVSL